ncbi:MAG: DoxX family membrane protein [Leptolyngbyaceae cyanobacterium bins.349]|nr:DoxX family membrane protein [Leptolyngbyaceae cyanobacterium bins.349]
MHTAPGLRRNDVAIAYILLRIIFGINFFNHGFTRLGDIGGFAQSMADLFKDTAMPANLVWLVGAIVPPVELIIGILLILGLATRGALVAGFVLMMVLQGGVTILKQWDTAASQLIYCLVFFLLLASLGFNAFSLDAVLRRRKQLSLTETTETNL